MSSEFQLTLLPRNVESAEPEAKPALQQAQSQLGFVPNMYARMANSPGLLNTYLQGYAAFRQRSQLTSAEQEVVFLTISREHGCEYCVAAHSMLAGTLSKVPPEVTQAIRDDRSIPDPKLAVLSLFTQRMVQSRGLPSRGDVDSFLRAGYSERHILEIILAISVKILSNYANHLFDTPVDSAFAACAWKRR
ncbi:MAG: carboxymuconolactone decarboxylase family protein [Dehalococcoidia bacterium]